MFEHIDLGRLAYEPALREQHHRFDPMVQAKLDRRALPCDGAGYVLTVEHEPVYTLGKSGKQNHLLLSNPELAELGAEFHQSSRGGGYHLPRAWSTGGVSHFGPRKAQAGYSLVHADLGGIGDSNLGVVGFGWAEGQSLYRRLDGCGSPLSPQNMCHGGQNKSLGHHARLGP